MLKMTAEGGNVDAANCVARYTLLGRTADHHRTFCSHGQVSSFARSLNDLQI